MSTHRAISSVALTLGVGAVAAVVLSSWWPIALAVLGPWALLLLAVGTEVLPKAEVGWPHLFAMALFATAVVAAVFSVSLLRSRPIWSVFSYVAAVLWACMGFFVFYIGAHAA
jgi:hypothetical protein